MKFLQILREKNFVFNFKIFLSNIIGDFYLKLNGINDERLTDYPTSLGKIYPLNLYRDLVGQGLGVL